MCSIDPFMTYVIKGMCTHSGGKKAVISASVSDTASGFWINSLKKMPSCCVVGCQNRSTKIKGLNFYRIPSGKRPFNANRRRLWLQAIKRVDWTEDIIKNARICGAHFISGK